MTPSQDARLPLAGRILIAALFLPSGLAKIAGFAGVTGYIASKGLPLPALGAAGAIVLEVAGALALIAGWQTRLAAWLLIAYVAVVTPLFHGFWAMAGEQAMANQQAFFKNVAVMGGLLLLAAYGPGRISVQAWLDKDKNTGAVKAGALS